MEGEQKPDNNQADRAAWREQQKQAYAQAREEFYDRKKSDADPHPGGSFDEQMRAQSEAKKTKIDEEMKRASAEGNSAEARTDSGGAGTAGTGGSESTSGPNPEDIAQAELNQAVNDFEAKQSQIAQMRAKKTGRFASLAKSLGIKTRDLSNDPEVMSLEEESHDLYRNLISKGIHLYKGDRQQLENFLQDHDEFEVFRSTYDKEMDERAKSCGWPENVLAGFQKIGQKWSEMSW
ncbi:MAG TPA: hypothetical protein VK254_02875, partial [Candidatus Bathyarchaeia archaeon]|nr:hypothetical protein [Candidatus Bathyarchaeia archaeon]